MAGATLISTLFVLSTVAFLRMAKDNIGVFGSWIFCRLLCWIRQEELTFALVIIHVT